MYRSKPPNSSVIRLAVLGPAAALLLLAAGSATAAAAPGPTDQDAAPQLSISVDNGHTSTAAGDSLTYTITLQNLGAADLPGVLISQTVPAGLQFGSADADGAVTPTGVSWTVDLNATGTATLHTTMTVAETPTSVFRLASVACANLAPDATPIVCASDSDLLPAGAAAESSQAASVAAAAEPQSGSNDWTWWIIGGSIGLLGVVTVAVLLTRQRKRGRQQLANVSTI